MDSFERFWSAYPTRLGSNPKTPARMKFQKLVAGGENANAIISGATAYASQQRSAGKVGTEYIAMSVTWLNQRRWEDYATPTNTGPMVSQVFIEVDTPQWRAWESWRRSHEGRGWPQTDNRTPTGIQRGWWFKTEWPPQVEAAE
jgi:hypothetical protein